MLIVIGDDDEAANVVVGGGVLADGFDGVAGADDVLLGGIGDDNDRYQVAIICPR